MTLQRLNAKYPNKTINLDTMRSFVYSMLMLRIVAKHVAYATSNWVNPVCPLYFCFMLRIVLCFYKLGPVCMKMLAI